jgi:hypothetical protein
LVVEHSYFLPDRRGEPALSEAEWVDRAARRRGLIGQPANRSVLFLDIEISDCKVRWIGIKNKLIMSLLSFPTVGKVALRSNDGWDFIATRAHCATAVQPCVSIRSQPWQLFRLSP